jgi:hypothetical protein
MQHMDILATLPTSNTQVDMNSCQQSLRPKVGPWAHIDLLTATHKAESRVDPHGRGPYPGVGEPSLTGKTLQ